MKNTDTNREHRTNQLSTYLLKNGYSMEISSNSITIKDLDTDSLLETLKILSPLWDNEEMSDYKPRKTIIRNELLAAFLYLQGHDMTAYEDGVVISEDISESLKAYSENTRVGILDLSRAFADLQTMMCQSCIKIEEWWSKR